MNAYSTSRRRMGRRLDAASRAIGLSFVLALAALAASGCALFYGRPTVRIADVRLGSVGLVGATAHVALTVVNPNSYALTAEEVRYRFAFDDEGADDDWQTLVEGESEEPIVVAAGDSTRVELSLPFSYEDVGRALESLLSVGELRYRIDGDVKFSAPGPDIRVPFDKRGSIAP